MNNKIKDSELEQFVNGELSEQDAQRIKIASENDIEIANKILKIKEFEEAFEQIANKEFPIPNNFLNEVTRELNSSEEKNKLSKESFPKNILNSFLSLSPIKLVSSSAIGGAIVTGFAMFFLVSPIVTTTMRGTDESNISNGFIKNETLNTFYNLEKNEGWNIYPSMAFKFETLSSDETINILNQGSEIKIGSKFILTIIPFYDGEVAISDIESENKNYIKVNQGEIKLFESVIEPPSGKTIIALSSKWLKESREYTFNLITIE